MAKINLKQYGITGTTEVIYNPSYDELYREETRKGLRGYEKGQVTEMGAVNVMTGVYTGRSPKDKFFVMDETTKDTIWWIIIVAGIFFALVKWTLAYFRFKESEIINRM